MCGNKYSFYDNAVKKKEILKATIVLVRGWEFLDGSLLSETLKQSDQMERETKTFYSERKMWMWSERERELFFATAWYKKVSTSYTSLFAQAGIHQLQDNRSSFLTLELKGRQRSRFVSNHYSQRKKGKTFVNVNCRQKVFLGKNNHQSFST